MKHIQVTDSGLSKIHSGSAVGVGEKVLERETTGACPVWAFQPAAQHQCVTLKA